MCYHIIALRKSIGIDIDISSKNPYNLTQLRVNKRPRKGKKTGRKQPLPGDIDVEAAPDAIETVSFSFHTAHFFKKICVRFGKNFCSI